MNTDELPYPYGHAALGGIVKSRDTDFEVVEELGFEPSGEGEHLLMQVEKTGLTTPQLVSRVAADYALHPRQIGYSGLKDRNALTTQWLSLHLPGKEVPAPRRPSGGYRVLRAQRHRAKLRRGTHKANLFRVKIRGIQELTDTTRRQLSAIAAHGMANYFGPQRFGRHADNVEQALAGLRNSRLKRQRKSLLLSALRSQLFNQVLARRIEMDCWRRPMDGDVFMLRGSHSIFSAKIDAEIRRRFESLDISSTASLYGAGNSLLQGEALRIEQQVFADSPGIVECLQQQQVRLQMRPLRVTVEDFAYQLDARQEILSLQAKLPAGSYLTSLLAHFLVAREPAQADLR